MVRMASFHRRIRPARPFHILPFEHPFQCSDSPHTRGQMPLRRVSWRTGVPDHIPRQDWCMDCT
jgi:hypothetical protein